MNLTGFALQARKSKKRKKKKKDYIHREMKFMIQIILINIKLTVSKIIILVRWLFVSDTCDVPQLYIIFLNRLFLLYVYLNMFMPREFTLHYQAIFGVKICWICLWFNTIQNATKCLLKQSYICNWNFISK